MPRKNSVKPFLKGGIYHVYNRGVEKRTIFLNNQDYAVFLRILKDSLSPPPIEQSNPNLTDKHPIRKWNQPLSVYQEVELLCYCLMPNHFHLLIKQNNEKKMKQFMQSISTRYSMYFNKKYKRVGSLFQGIYKAILIMDEPYLLHLSRYIHLNPINYVPNIVSAYSSYADYTGIRNTSWVKTDLILSFFGSSMIMLKDITSYKMFVEKYKADSTEFLGNYTLEDPEG